MNPRNCTYSIALIALTACAPETMTTDADVTRGAQLYANNCAACHGADARGAGEASLGLGAPPPGLRGLTLANDGVFPRDYVASTIDGLERSKHPTAAMPEFGAGNMGPLVALEEGDHTTPIPANLLALTRYIESVQDPR